MLKLRSVVVVAAVGTTALGSSTSSGQAFPNKPIRILTTGIGAGNDYAARLIAKGLAENIGQSVIVENRDGHPIIQVDTMMKAPPDGYTLMLHGGSLWTVPLLEDNVPYDVARDLAPVTLATTSPSVIVVHPSVPTKTLQELLALVRARPGELNNATGSKGSSSHLSGELFKSMAKVNIVNVQYKNAATQTLDLVAGRVQMMIAPPASVATQLKDGKLRALAVTSAEPSALFPSLPTVAASGVPGYEAVSRKGIFAPAKTPAATISLLNLEIAKALNKPDIKDRFRQVGEETVGSTSEDLAAKIKSETARLGKVIRDANIRSSR